MFEVTELRVACYSPVDSQTKATFFLKSEVAESRTGMLVHAWKLNT